MSDREVHHKDGTVTYWLSGRKVPEAKYREYYPVLKPVLNGTTNGLIGWRKPIWSDACAVHPSQIPAAMEFDRLHGVVTEYDKWGRPKFDEKDFRKRYLRAHGKFDRNAGYGDPAPNWQFPEPDETLHDPEQGGT